MVKIPTLKPGQLFTLIDHPNFVINVELKEDDSIFIHHSHLKNWGKTTYLQMLAAYADTKRMMKEDGHDHIFCFIPNDKKLLKFEGMLGWEFLEGFKNQDGEEAILMVQET